MKFEWHYRKAAVETCLMWEEILNKRKNIQTQKIVYQKGLGKVPLLKWGGGKLSKMWTVKTKERLSNGLSFHEHTQQTNWCSYKNNYQRLL